MWVSPFGVGRLRNVAVAMAVFSISTLNSHGPAARNPAWLPRSAFPGLCQDARRQHFFEICEISNENAFTKFPRGVKMPKSKRLYWDWSKRFKRVLEEVLACFSGKGVNARGESGRWDGKLCLNFEYPAQESLSMLNTVALLLDQAGNGDFDAVTRLYDHLHMNPSSIFELIDIFTHPFFPSDSGLTFKPLSFLTTKAFVVCRCRITDLSYIRQFVDLVDGALTNDKLAFRNLAIIVARHFGSNEDLSDFIGGHRSHGDLYCILLASIRFDIHPQLLVDFVEEICCSELCPILREEYAKAFVSFSPSDGFRHWFPVRGLILTLFDDVIHLHLLCILVNTQTHPHAPPEVAHRLLSLIPCLHVIYCSQDSPKADIARAISGILSYAEHELNDSEDETSFREIMDCLWDLLNSTEEFDGNIEYFYGIYIDGDCCEEEFPVEDMQSSILNLFYMNERKKNLMRQNLIEMPELDISAVRCLDYLSERYENVIPKLSRESEHTIWHYFAFLSIFSLDDDIIEITRRVHGLLNGE
jgi:hypothetical protein